MSISMHLDEYMARRGIVPDDTVVNDDPCAIFDGKVEHDGKSQQDLEESERRLEEAESAILDMLGD
ncbi:hypothetical protein [Corynebacterium amycolatum]|uniref:hypothetical protein n=1 Tax=Corynebacterium amycolatum TaxID=43765 RepID=UPI000185C4D3|nr:hypothetical protein [Corynebacterium amycolatum]EEB62815.1 hypothetical protein CORAM0001_1185 [Corynebacterium amycolatum SK46]